MTGIELFFGGVAALAVVSLVVKARTGARRARAAADIAHVGTSPVSLVGRVVVTATLIVGAEWLIITHSANHTLWLIALGIPALVTAGAIVRATTVMQIGPSQRRGSGRR